MVYTNNMEMIAMTTAMADARAATQATSREMQNQRRLILYEVQGGPDIDATLQACNDMLAVIQVHLSYLVQKDSLLLVPGTNAENSGNAIILTVS
jgi:hypothetical protein